MSNIAINPKDLDGFYWPIVSMDFAAKATFSEVLNLTLDSIERINAGQIEEEIANKNSGIIDLCLQNLSTEVPFNQTETLLRIQNSYADLKKILQQKMSWNTKILNVPELN